MNTVAPSPKKSSSGGPLISANILAVSRFFDSLAALFQETCPKFPQEGRLKLPHFLKICRPNLHHVTAIKMFFKLLFDEIFLSLIRYKKILLGSGAPRIWQGGGGHDPGVWGEAPSRRRIRGCGGVAPSSQQTFAVFA